jgi:hypothetical protein
LFWWYLVHTLQRVSAAWNGMIDGWRSIPHEAAELPAVYLRVMQSRGREVVHRITLAFYRADRRLYARWVAAEGALATAIQEQHLQEATCAEARSQYEAITASADAFDQKHNEPGAWYCPPGSYRLSVCLLAFADLPLTYWALQVFDLSNLYLIPVTILVVASLAVLGHFAGDYLRRLNLPIRRLLWGVLALAGFLTISLTYLRETALTGSETGTISPLASALVFVGITAVGFVLPALLSLHLRHMPLSGQVRRAKRQWQKQEGRVRGARRAVTRAQRLLAQARANRQTLFVTRQRQCELISAMTDKLMDIYATANVRWRKGHTYPPGLYAQPPVQVPEALLHLDWELPLADRYAKTHQAHDWGLRSAD